MENPKITIIGAGSWGTALAVNLHLANKDVKLWARRPELTEELSKSRISPYMPDINIPETLEISNAPSLISHAEIILWVVPVQKSIELLKQIKPFIKEDTPIIICSKGLELETGQSLSRIFAQHLPNPVGVLSGPNFADEVAKNLPAASTLAFKDLDLSKKLAIHLRHKNFRIYAHHDVIGIELAGALKNVAAIAAGIVIGKELGQNCLAALITRANAEIRRLSTVLGAELDTSQTLAGIGDLMLTCSNAKSRNASLGIALASGLPLAEILNSRKSVSEGVATTKAAFTLAKNHNIHAPIISAVYDILYNEKPIDDVVHALLSSQHQQEF